MSKKHPDDYLDTAHNHINPAPLSPLRLCEKGPIRFTNSPKKRPKNVNGYVNELPLFGAFPRP